MSRVTFCVLSRQGRFAGARPKAKAKPKLFGCAWDGPVLEGVASTSVFQVYLRSQWNAAGHCSRADAESLPTTSDFFRSCICNPHSSAICLEVHSGKVLS